ncbi:MAG: N-acetyl-alpha-D-glucosaminyl L-malate synthase BshA [bacterium]
MDALRIAIVCYPGIGGSGIVATELGKSLARRGHNIHFVSYDVPQRLGSFDGHFSFHHVDVPLYPLFRFEPYMLALASTLYELVVDGSVDLIHVHYAIPHSVAAYLARQMLRENCERDVKIVTTLHGTDADLVGQMPSLRPSVEFGLHMSDRVTAVSRYLRDTTIEQLKVTREVEVIYNPIDTDLYSPPKNRAARDSQVQRLVHISNFRPVKRIHDAIKVFDLIRYVVPSRLLFVGKGPDRSTAEMLVERLGLSDCVEFLGAVLHADDILKRADLLLSTSEKESFGLTIAEAMACEVPVVATNVGGVPEVVEDGVSGKLVPLGNVQSMAQAAIEILQDPARAREMGRAGRQRVIERFEQNKIVKQYEDLYQRVLNL